MFFYVNYITQKSKSSLKNLYVPWLNVSIFWRISIHSHFIWRRKKEKRMKVQSEILRKVNNNKKSSHGSKKKLNSRFWSCRCKLEIQSVSSLYENLLQIVIVDSGPRGAIFNLQFTHFVFFWVSVTSSTQVPMPKMFI